jgi:hypothetical protein
MKHDCDICQGRKKIRLPIYRRAMAFSADVLPDPVESSREYPCPECADVTRIERVQAVRQETFAPAYINDARFIDHVRSGLARQIGAFLMDNGYIKFERSPDDEKYMRFAMRATVGVVRPNQLDNLEERIAERQTEVASAVVQEAERQINNWGSYYGHAAIDKDQATRFVRESLGYVLKKRAEWKPVDSPAGGQVA